ncbi:MAG: hypothetical protein ABJA81_05190 [Nocardioidaceae bacterium]
MKPTTSLSAARRRRALVALVSLAALTSACTSIGDSGAPARAADSSTKTPSTSSSSATSAPGSMIEQPVVTDIPVAADAKRVDLARPTFSDPTNVSNPLFPVSQQESILMVGHVDGKSFRTEVTLLPYTRVVTWGDQHIETLVSQYTAYLDGRIQEVAYDLYAQSDDGAVWYLGEDVADLESGVITTKEGTWTAGVDGPPAMIMPGDPKVGQVHRTENIPGVAFEEITINAVDQTVKGPFGPVRGSLIATELHMDAAKSPKVFAPGYGEFYSRDGKDVEALAFAIPTNAKTEPTPGSLSRLATASDRIDAAVDRRDWPKATGVAHSMTQAWSRFSKGEVPWRIEPLMVRAVDGLDRAVARHDASAAHELAFEVASRSIDLELLYQPAADVNVTRFDLWAGRLVDDSAAGDVAAVNGDLFTLEYIRDRILDGATPADVAAADTGLADVTTGVLDGNLHAAGKAAARLRTTIAAL